MNYPLYIHRLRDLFQIKICRIIQIAKSCLYIKILFCCTFFKLGIAEFIP